MEHLLVSWFRLIRGSRFIALLLTERVAAAVDEGMFLCRCCCILVATRRLG